MAKIPCSVSLLTLNAEEGLAECLDSLSAFEEIIVCDGNSTDRTVEIAKQYGVRVIKQYDTDELNVPCAMDKATVRERAMAASTFPWRFFMDADDTLSHEVVEEIQEIVTDPEPKHFIWRMPTRVFIDGRAILHEATYPSYQTRLVHESVGAHFKGPVHDHLVYDAKRFPVGTLKNYYNFHWSQERVANYWHYTYTYIQRELKTMGYHGMSIVGFLRWGVYFRLRIFLGYILWRLPRMYVRYGFKDSMPPRLEAIIAFQHLYLLIAGIGRFIASRYTSVFFYRLVTGGLGTLRRDFALTKWGAYGRVLDLGSGKKYWDYLQTARWNRRIPSTIHGLPSARFDTILHLENVEPVSTFLPRLLPLMSSGGVLIATAPDTPSRDEFASLGVHAIGKNLNLFRAVKK